MPPPLGPEDLAASLVRLSFVIQGMYARASAAHGLTPAQAKLLCILREETRGMTELAQMLGLTKSSISGLVDRTHQRQLIERQFPQEDRRLVTIRLSPLGQGVAEAFYTALCSEIATAIQALPDRDRQRLARLIPKVLRGAEACNAPTASEA